jgi:hypothetical protein
LPPTVAGLTIAAMALLVSHRRHRPSRRRALRHTFDEAVLDLRAVRLVIRLVWRLWTTGAAPVSVRRSRS